MINTFSVTTITFTGLIALHYIQVNITLVWLGEVFLVGSVGLGWHPSKLMIDVRYGFKIVLGVLSFFIRYHFESVFLFSYEAY